MLKLFKSLVPVIMLVSILMLPCLSLADGPADKLMKVGKDSGYNTKSNEASFPVIAGKIIGVVLSLLGIVFLALFIYAGVLWMIAAGNEEKVTRSKDTMRRAIIGLIIVLASYAVSQYVFFALLD